MAATAAVLIGSTGHTSALGGRRRSQVGRSSPAGHVGWWSGLDPFIAGSGWTPLRMRVGVDDPSGTPRLAWQELIRFVELRVPDPLLRTRAIAAADALERRDRCVLTAGLSYPDWAVAALIARYGTASYVRAHRLLQRGCHATLFPLLPQASSVLEDSAEANSVVFAAEVRSEYLRMLTWTRKVGSRPLFEADLAAAAAPVPWSLTEVEGERWLQWRCLRRMRFDRACATRLRSAV